MNIILIDIIDITKYPLGAGSEVAQNNQTAKISTGEAIPVSPNKQIVGKF